MDSAAAVPVASAVEKEVRGATKVNRGAAAPNEGGKDRQDDDDRKEEESDGRNRNKNSSNGDVKNDIMNDASSSSSSSFSLLNQGRRLGTTGGGESSSLYAVASAASSTLRSSALRRKSSSTSSTSLLSRTPQSPFESSALSSPSLRRRRLLSLSHDDGTQSGGNRDGGGIEGLTINRLRFGGALGQLYGRSDELAQLRRCWDDLVAATTRRNAAGNNNNNNNKIVRRFVAIRGRSGTGKTALAESLRSVALSKGRLYLQGKFPQRVRQQSSVSMSSSSSSAEGEPYAAFAMACQELCDVALGLLDEVDDDVGNSNCKSNLYGPNPNHGSCNYSSAPSSNYRDRFRYRKCFSYTLSDLRRKLTKELGKDVDVLLRVMPGLQQVLQVPQRESGTDDGSYNGNGGESEATLHVFEKMGSAKLPVVPTTDDVTTNHESGSDEEASTTSTTSPQQARHQFKFAFRKFVRVLAANFGPVVLVLDDLQWADPASRELVEALLTDREASRIMVVGCYRDDGDYQHHHQEQQHPDAPHLAAMASIKAHAELQGTGLEYDEIAVDNLSVDQVNDLLVDVLSSQRPATDGLADCVHKKTHGNVFFVIQFLTMLQDSDLLVYNFGVMGWQWDVAEIQIRTAATDNVVGLVCTKMRGLPESIGRALPVLACLGSSFTVAAFDRAAARFQWKDDLQGHQSISSLPPGTDGDEVHDAQDRSIQGVLTAASVLNFCVGQGLVEEAGDVVGARRYQWVHDKIQEAAFTLVSEDKLNTLKLELAKILFEDCNEEELERNLFVVANLLAADSRNDPTSLPRQRPVDVARLFLRAGDRAIEKAAFDQATRYLLAGISLLPPNHWTDHYKLSLELYSSAAEGFFCTGNFDQMSAHCNELIRQANKPVLDKRRAYMVLIDATGAAGRQLEALQICREVLSKLGYTFPTRAIRWHVLRVIVKIKATLQVATSHELLPKLPTMDDPEKQLVTAILSKAITWMYITKSDLFPLAVFMGLKMTLSEGVSVQSPVLFALVGLLLSGFYFDYVGGAAFGDQGVALLKQAKGSRKVESRVQFLVHCFVFCWVRPISLSIKPLLEGYKIGMATGDTESGSWCIKYYLEYQFRTGMPLDDFIADCAFYTNHVREVKMKNILALMTNLWQTALFLTGANAFDGTFTGELVRQKADLDAAGEFYAYLFVAIHRTLMYTQFVLGRHDLVYESIKKTDMDNNGYEKCFPGIAGIMHLYAFNGFSMILLFRETHNKKYLRMGKKFALKIKGWAKVNPNVTHYDSLFDAEFDSLRGDNYSAAKHYEGAIVYAGRRGLTQDRALAHELFGEHLARLNPVDHGQDAEFHLNESIKLYTEWGAHAKVRLMNEKHSKILGPPSMIEIDNAATS